MAYYSLKKIFHMARHDAEAALEAEWAARHSSPSTVTWPYFVEEWESFVVVTVELAALLHAVLRNEQQVATLWQQLPSAAQGQYTRGLIIEEIRSTNEIEGIHSTRQEVSEALAAAANMAQSKTGQGSAKRYQEMAASFLLLFVPSAFGEATRFPRTLAEMRTLYDKLLEHSLEPADLPDGTYFRTEPVFIESGTARIHAGAVGEEAINVRMRVMLDSQSDDRALPLVDALAGHFMLEHTHPYYDGNGRFGRFLLAMRLKEILSAPTALSLSAEIMRSKDRYYKAFEEAEHPKNRAELTHFVATMLEMLLRAQEELIESFAHKRQALDNLEEALVTWEKKQRHAAAELTDDQRTCLFLFGQAALFNPYGQLQAKEIAGYLNRSASTARKVLRTLEEAELVETEGQRPRLYRMGAKGKELLGL